MKTTLCHGQHHALVDGTKPFLASRVFKWCWNIRLKSHHLLWHIQAKGLWNALKCSVIKIFGSKSTGNVNNKKHPDADMKCESEILNLKPGEWVKVKPEEVILGTLDQEGKYKGLRWMCNMRKFCGNRYRVYKRLDRMILESTGEYREIKNTVLLEGVICDGLEWYGCDRSCFHFWREIWLERAEDPPET